MWEIFMKFGIPNLHQCPDFGKRTDGDISDVWISDQSLINESCQNSGTSHDIDMKR